MADITFTGAIDGDMDKAGNWDAGVPTGADVALFDGNEANHPASGTCGASYTDSSSAIMGGVFVGDVYSRGPINNGTFNGKAYLYSETVYDGTFNADVETSGGVVIVGGTYYGTVVNGAVIGGGTYHGEVNNAGTIGGGTFNGLVGNSGEISGGAFEGPVANDNVISGGTYDGGVTNNNQISDGTFNGAVNNAGYVYGGTFNFALKMGGGPWLYRERGINGSGILGVI